MRLLIRTISRGREKLLRKIEAMNFKCIKIGNEGNIDIYNCCGYQRSFHSLVCLSQLVENLEV